MIFLKKINRSLAYKARILYAFFKRDEIFEKFSRMKIRLFSSDIRVFEQIFLDENYFFFPEFFSPNVIIDAGANVGFSSIWFSQKFKNAKIIAVEPEKNNYRILRENTKNWDNIQSIEAAIWPVDSKIWIKDITKRSWSFETSEIRGDHSESVNAISIQTILKRYDLKKIDILKVDIEGAEGALFGSFENNWIDLVSCIMIETHDKKIPGVSKIVDNALIGRGFLKFKTKDLSIYFSKSIL